MWAPVGGNVSTLFLALRAAEGGAIQNSGRPKISAAAIAGIVTGVIAVLVILFFIIRRKGQARKTVKDVPRYTSEYPLPPYVHPLPPAHLPAHHPMMSINEQASGYYQQPWAPRVHFGEVAVYKV